MQHLNFRFAGFFVRDVPATVGFYQRAFGIGMRYMHPSLGYAELATGDTLLGFLGEEFLRSTNLLGGIEMICAKPGKMPIGTLIALVSHDLDRDWRRAVDAGAVVVKLPEPKPWGQTAGYLQDMNGALAELCTPSLRD